MTDPIIITAPVIAGVTVEEVKTHLRITHDDEDTKLEGFTYAATRDFEMICNCSLYETELEVAHDAFPSVFRGLPRAKPLISVTSIKYWDSDDTEHTLSASLYFVDTYKAIVTPAYNESWPSFTARPSSAVVIRYKAGQVPGSPVTPLEAGIRVCLAQMVGALYLNLESVVPTERATLAAYAQDPTARRLLEHYRKSYAF